MVDHMVDTSRPRGRVEVQVGAGRRRRWSAEAKGRIVAESYGPGAVVSDVARRHDISPQHLFAWRKAARAGLLALPAEQAPLFVPVVSELLRDRATAAGPAQGCASITIEIAGTIVCAPAGIDACWLGDVLGALKATT
jgi:transposase